MFTGIIQAVGVVRSNRPTAAGARLEIEAPDLPCPVPEGSSLCVGGVCLTVVSSDPSNVRFDVVFETLNQTTLGSLKPGSRVNLEPALRADGRLDGHVVQGHVDSLGRVRRIERNAGGQLWTFAVPADLMPFIIPKGSIAVDGVSLTVVRVEDGAFCVAMIPTTLERTTLGGLRAGDAVNVETDVLARTVVAELRRMRAEAGPEPLTVDTLREQGW